MCTTNISEITKETLLEDLAVIRQKLADVELESTKVFKAIEPLANHLIAHLTRMIYWVDKQAPNKKPKKVKK